MLGILHQETGFTLNALSDRYLRVSVTLVFKQNHTSFFAETFSFAWLSVENNVSLQDNSDDPKDSNQNGDMEWMRLLTIFNQICPRD